MQFRLFPLLLTTTALSFACNSSRRIVVSSGDTHPAANGSCQVGEISLYGSTDCAAVGPTAAPDGFVLDKGAADLRVQTADHCTGPSRAAIGESSCVALDECDAAFPPAGANVVVGGPAAPGGKTATTIAEALAMVPAGGTVAVDSGTYREALTVKSNVHIVGRCTSKVILLGGGAAPTTTDRVGNAGIRISGSSANLELKGMTISNFDTAVAMMGGKATIDSVRTTGVSQSVRVDQSAEAQIARSAFEARAPGGDQTDGVTVLRGSRATVTDTEVRGSESAIEALESASLSVHRSVLRTTPSNESFVVFVAGNAKLDMDESLAASRQSVTLGVGIASSENAGAVDNSDVHIARTELTQSGAYYKQTVISVQGGAKLTLEESTVHYDAALAIGAVEQGTQVVATQSSIVCTAEDGADAGAINGLMGASVELDGVAVENARGYGAYVNDVGSHLAFHRSLLTGTRAGAVPKGGAEGSAFGILAADEAAVEIDQSTLTDNEQLGLVVGWNAVGSVDGTVISNVFASPGGALGEAVEIASATLTVQDSLIKGSGDAAMVVEKGAGTVRRSHFEDNPIGISLWESTVRQGSDASNGQELVLDGDTFDNTPATETVRDMTYVLPSPPSKTPSE